MTRLKKIRFVEFLLIGLIFGMGEDILAVVLVTGHQPDFRTFGLVALVALPFAIISELIVDHPRFWEKMWPERK